MPSKAELQKQITELRENLKGATQRLTAVEALPPGGKHYLPMPKTDLCILNVERDIVSSTSWDIGNSLHERKRAGEDSCLPCEEEYFNLRNFIDILGSAYSLLPIKSWADDEKISGEVKQQLARELFAIGQAAKHAEINCGINLSGVRKRIVDLRPIAGIGRWEEFMKGKELLIADLEQDLKAIIPNINITGAKPIRHAIPSEVIFPKDKPKLIPELELTPEQKQYREHLRKLGEKLPGQPPKIWKLKPPKVTIKRTIPSEEQLKLEETGNE